MSTFNVHWFHPIGFRPALVVQRKDFVGDLGVHEYVIVAPDADIPYSSKYEGPLDFVLTPEFITEVPLTSNLIPRQIYDWPDPPTPIYSFCCSSYNPPMPPPVVIPTPESLVLLMTAILFLVVKSRVCHRSALKLP